jgi:hypothetical protein
MSEKRQLVLQSLVARDCDIKDLNGTLDKLRVAADRQVAFADLEKLKLFLQQQEEQAATHAKRIAQVDQNVKTAWARSNKRGDPVLSGKERQEQQQAYETAEAMKQRIAKVKQDIADLQAITGA